MFNEKETLTGTSSIVSDTETVEEKIMFQKKEKKKKNRRKTCNKLNYVGVIITLCAVCSCGSHVTVPKGMLLQVQHDIYV